MTFIRNDDDVSAVHCNNESWRQVQAHDVQMRPFCAAHKAYRVGPSEIDGAGRGAFAVRDLKKGSTIGSYVIATVKQTEAEFRDEHPSGRATHTAKNRESLLHSPRGGESNAESGRHVEYGAARRTE